MLRRVEDLYKELAGMVKKNFTIAQRALAKIATVKSNKITLLLERHNPEILQGIHVG